MPAKTKRAPKKKPASRARSAAAKRPAARGPKRPRKRPAASKTGAFRLTYATMFDHL